MLDLVDAFQSARVTVFGDLLADEFIYGEVARVSREAPVLILDYDSTEIVPGGAGNAANNVAALGGSPIAVGVAGRDDSGRRLLDRMKRRIDVRRVVRPATYRTPTKTRTSPAASIRRSSRSSASIGATRPSLSDADRSDRSEARLLQAAARSAALLVSDYGTGLVTAAAICACAGEIAARGNGRPAFFVDSRYALTSFHGITACTPNESEVEHLFGVRIGENLRVLEKAGRDLLAQTRARAVLVTRGSRGMALFEAGRPTVHIPIVGLIRSPTSPAPATR